MALITPIIQRWIDDGRRDPDALWGRAADELPWFRKWDRVFEADPPTFRWFAGGQTNLAYNAVDRHVHNGHGGRAALIYFNERGERVVQTYAQLLRVAAALRGLGIAKRDRITIYMPPCPESIALMLATVRLGAIHSIVFAGFGAQALGDRIAASGSRVVFATDVVYRKGQHVPLLPIVEDALRVAEGSVERIAFHQQFKAVTTMSPLQYQKTLRLGCPRTARGPARTHAFRRNRSAVVQGSASPNGIDLGRLASPRIARLQASCLDARAGASVLSLIHELTRFV